jgi:4-amino-4-deoxy-L-arabinose transferase-like glycosyltransferase
MVEVRRKLLLVLLMLAAAGLYLVGNGGDALWDRDEPRYAQTSRQMLAGGDWVVPHYLDLVRTAKPVFIYWCQASAMAVFGDNSFAARLPSAVAIVLLLALLAIVLWKPIGPQRTLWTVFILASSALVVVEAKFCITDAVLLLWITIAQMCLYALWRGNDAWLIVVAMAVAVGLAGLTKGPVVLGILAMTVIALGALGWRQPRVRRTACRQLAMKLLVGIAIVTIIVLPWVVMVNHRASQFLRQAVGHEVWDRMLTPLEQHTGPPGYYLLSIWGTFFPWSLMLPMAIGLGWRHRADPRSRFALAAVIGPWVMLECIRTKLPHYFLPVYPPLAFLLADALVRCLHGEHDDVRSKPFRIAAIGWAVLVGIVAWAPFLAVRWFPAPQPWTAMVCVGLAGDAVAIAAAVLLWRKRSAAGAMVMGLGAMAVFALLYGWYLPRAEFLRLSPRIARVLIDHGVTQPHQVLMMDYMEPSLAFYQGGTIREGGDLGFTPGFLPRLPQWMVVTRTLWDHARPGMRDAFDIVDDEYGLAYADHGRWLHVLVLHRKNRVDGTDLAPVSTPADSAGGK